MNTQGIFLKVCLVLSLVGAFTACAYVPKGQIAGGTTEFNLAVEKAQNEMLLLNIVRASQRHPMYFTVLNDIKGSMAYTLSTGNMYIPLGKFGSNSSGSGIYSITPSATFTTNPIFDVALLNSKEFVRGMLESVQPETFNYYWQQGWPKAMLLYLFVHRIEKKGHTYKNNPFDVNTYGAFQKEIEGIADVDNDCNLVVTKAPPDSISPEITAAKVAEADLQKLIEVHKAGLVLVPVKKDNGKIETYQLKPLKKDDYAVECKTGRDKAVSERYKLLPDSQVQNVDDKETAEATMYLRSPESIMYYLGELVRAEKINDKTKATRPKLKEGKDGECQPWLFVAREAGAEDTNPFVAVDYEGITYVIPRTHSEQLCPEDRSTQVLSLIGLVTAKQSASDLPAPVGVVTTIGR